MADERATRRKLYARSEDVRAKVKEKTAARKKKHRDFMNALKSVPCADCKQTFPPVCMDFDHRPGTGKLKAVGAMVHQSLDKIMAEVAKCDVVCSNCHRIRTALRR